MELEAIYTEKRQPEAYDSDTSRKKKMKQIEYSQAAGCSLHLAHADDTT